MIKLSAFSPQSLASKLLWYSGLSSLARRVMVERGRFVLVFHGISRHRIPHLPPHSQPWHTAAELRSVLSWLRQRFIFLTPKEFMLTGKGGVLLTFDDGFANNYTNALPVLKEFNAPAVFFVSTQHVIDPRDWLPATRQMAVAGWRNEQSVPREIAADLYDGLSTEELAECAQCPLITIGSHTVSHPFLSRCVPDKLSFELQESKRLLENISGQTVELFAYPTGDYNQAVADAVGSAGYRTAFALDTRRVTVSRLEIPRVGIYASDAPYLGLKLSGLYHRALLGQPAEVAVG